MTAKEYLNRISVLEDEIKRKQQRCITLRDVAMNTSVNNSNIGVQKTRDKNSFESILTRVIDLEREIKADEERLVDLKAEIIEKIKLVPNVEYQMLLELRHVCFKAWDEIADAMNFSVQHVFRLHSTALQELSKKIEDESKCD